MSKNKFELTANRLSRALSSKNMTQQELANLSGVSKASISQYMNGRNRPNNVNAYLMARWLEVKPDWLMGFDAGDILIETIKFDEDKNYNYYNNHKLNFL